MMRAAIAALVFLASALVAAEVAAQPPAVAVFKSPWCGCCVAWIEHLRREGFEVSVEEHEDMAPVKASLGVPADLASCHTALVGGYVVEGHVPAADIRRLLAEAPKAAGLAVPGMPIGSPGMEQGSRKDPYAVILFGAGDREVFSRY